MLSVTDSMPAWEQVPTRQDRIRQAAAMTGNALALVAAAIGFLLSAILACSSLSYRAAARACPHEGTAAPVPAR